MIVCRASGDGADAAFSMEAGGHRWQRIPPTEKKGRVQSSSVTVAVFPDVPEATFSIRESDLEVTATKGSGAGGQARNKLETAIVMKHLPTGVTVRAERERSQIQNRRVALDTLRARLAASDAEQRKGKADASRRSQVGSGMRGDKVRTVQVQNGRVTDHRSGRKIPYERFLKGDLEGLRCA